MLVMALVGYKGTPMEHQEWFDLKYDSHSRQFQNAPWSTGHSKTIQKLDGKTILDQCELSMALDPTQKEPRKRGMRKINK